MNLLAQITFYARILGPNIFKPIPNRTGSWSGRFFRPFFFCTERRKKIGPKGLAFATRRGRDKAKAPFERGRVFYNTFFSQSNLASRSEVSFGPESWWDRIILQRLWLDQLLPEIHYDWKFFWFWCSCHWLLVVLVALFFVLSRGYS